MQALSFAVHIPLVCFGVAFPALVLGMEWLGRRTRRPAAARARPALVEGDDRAVRRRRRDRDDSVVRARAAVARVHGHLRRRVRPRVRAGGLLVLRRGDLHSDLRLRLGSAVTASAHARRHPGRDRRLQRFADGDRGERLDEPSDRLPAARTGARSTSSRSGRCSATRTSGTRWCTCTWRPSSSPGSSRRASTRSPGCADGATVTCGWRWPCRWSWRRSRRRRRSSSATGRRARSPRTSRRSWPRSRGSAEPRRARRIHIGGWYDENRGEVRYGIAIPKLLSLLAFHDPNATVRGLDSVPADDRPPVNVVRVAFLTMVGIGTLMAVFGVLLLVVWWRRRRAARDALVPPRRSPRSARCRWSALIAGWVTTEVGRQPWVVYGHMRTEDAVTGAERHPGRLRRAGRRSTWRSRGDRVAAATAGAARRSSMEAPTMGLAELPLLLALVGLAAYVVLGGADFGAGLWYMLLAGRAAAAAARPHLPRDGSGVGGKPRLADLRARGRAGPHTRPRSGRSSRRSTSRCSSPRSGSSCAARATRCAAWSRVRARSASSARSSALSRC